MTISRFSGDFFNLFFFFFWVSGAIIIHLHQTLVTLRSCWGLAGGRDMQSRVPHVLFLIVRRIVFASFYCLWHQIKKVPVMCEMSSRVFFFLSISWKHERATDPGLINCVQAEWELQRGKRDQNSVPFGTSTFSVKKKSTKKHKYWLASIGLERITCEIKSTCLSEPPRHKNPQNTKLIVSRCSALLEAF